MDPFQLPETFVARMREANIDQQRFSRISCELLGRGSIYRGASEIQRVLYDDAIRVVDMLAAFWGMAGFRLEYDTVVGYIQLYPPGAEVPGRQSDENFEADAAVRRRLSSDIAALVIMLRYMYDEHVLQGHVEEGGEVPVNIEDIAEKMRIHLKRKMPTGQVERLRLLTELRFREVVKFGEGAHLVGSSARIAILPPIMAVISRDICVRAIAVAEARAMQEPQAQPQAAAEELQDTEERQP